MADIKKELNDIKNAVYGKEVRGAIHDGIKKINEEVEDATDLSESAKHQVENIQQQVNQLVVEGDSSVEAAQARVDADGNAYTTLKERLDTEYTEVTSQLAETEQIFNNSLGINFSNTIGMSVSHDQSPTNFQLLKEHGVKFVRYIFLWQWIEKNKGVYDFINNGVVNYDTFINDAISNGFTPVMQLAYTNSLYGSEKALNTEEMKTAFVNFASACSLRYKDKGIIWQIYNEPNGSWFWSPQTNSVNDYVDVLKRVYPIIKGNDPSGMVVAPQLHSIRYLDSLSWLERAFELGLLDNLDALVVHGYRPEQPETIINDIVRVKGLIANYTTKDIPIAVGEWGYSTPENWDGTGNPAWVESETQQAQYITRMFLVNNYLSLLFTINYVWTDTGIDETNIEHHFGMFNKEQTIAKESAVAFKAMTTILKNHHFIKRINVGSDNDFVFKYADTNNNVAYVFWTTGATHNIILNASVTNATVFNMKGETINQLSGEFLELTISQSPNYLVTTEERSDIIELDTSGIVKDKEIAIAWAKMNGLGKSKVVVDGSVNEINNNGFYKVWNSVTDKPSNGYSDLLRLGDTDAHDNGSEILIDYEYNKIFFRTKTSNTWGKWIELAQVEQKFVPEVIIPAIPPKGTVTVNIPFPGLEVNDVVEAIPRSVLAPGVVYYAWVSQVDNVQLRFSNIEDIEKPQVSVNFILQRINAL